MMTYTSSLALFGAMLILALIPGPGVLAVVARTLAVGMKHGFSTVVGIVAGDFVFITLALFGLTALSQLMGSSFVIIKYIGAAYLIWMGISFAVARRSHDEQVTLIREPSHFASFTAGLVTTLSNPKAILFYLSFFPAFLDLSQVSVLDAVVLYSIATVAVGGVMLGYAYVAYKAKNSFRFAKGNRTLRYGSGLLLAGSGIFMAARG
ncbi:LysE family translocator [Celerinatantimonas sp. YJH-8]|uniref:LysE family translocator n=1 Tax=Celerinatantimonas sp. YJH-8 TaxID=3228714 RepID=UPI0038C2E59D